ncbi:MAG: MauE/DoxX family redox-associated membrane protein [Verrucomicrobiota bacterium]
MSIFWFLLRLAFGALFIFSGVMKLKDPIFFADVVRNYQLIGDPIAPAMALFVPWVEIFAGIAVMLDRFARGGSFVLTGALMVFTLAIAISWIRGLDITCGCFGQNEELNYPVKMAQNVVLLAIGIAIWWKAEMGGFASRGEAVAVAS